MTRDHFEQRNKYFLYVSAVTEAGRIRETYENLKDLCGRGFVSEERVRDAEKKYLAAKAEVDRLYLPALWGGQPEAG